MSLQEALRAIRPLIGDARGVLEAPPLERSGALGGDLPQIASCVPVEPPGARPIVAADGPLVAAFVDGVQRSRLLGHVGAAPIVFATAAAAVRERVDRQLRTWDVPRVSRQLLVSRHRVGEVAWTQLVASGVPVVDTTDGLASSEVPLHPHALRTRALELVALERERLERQLAAAWCETVPPDDAPAQWLWIDGGIAGNLAIDAAAPAFGVVKSHTTLYGDAAAVSAALALRAGERSPAFLVGHRPRRAIASWYLRLRDAPAGDPLFGLVRVEVAPPDDALAQVGAPAFTAHCDRLSAGILLERAPLALPDARWDTLVYGVHACELYLQALIGP